MSGLSEQIAEICSDKANISPALSEQIDDKFALSEHNPALFAYREIGAKRTIGGRADELKRGISVTARGILPAKGAKDAKGAEKSREIFRVFSVFSGPTKTEFRLIRGCREFRVYAVRTA